MMRRLCLVLCVAALLPMAPAAAATTTVILDNEELQFTPAIVAGRAGDSVTWEMNDGFHNVSSKTGMFRSGDPTDQDFEFTRTFSAGTFPYVCELHAAEGMKGTIKVRPRASAAPDGAKFTVQWATASTNTGSMYRVQYRVDGGDWRTWRASTSSRSGVFGAGGSPVTVQSGTAYGFRAKSLRGENASGYSPVTTFTP